MIAHIWFKLTTHLSTSIGWKAELAWDISWTICSRRTKMPVPQHLIVYSSWCSTNNVKSLKANWINLKCKSFNNAMIHTYTHTCMHTHSQTESISITQKLIQHSKCYCLHSRKKALLGINTRQTVKPIQSTTQRRFWGEGAGTAMLPQSQVWPPDEISLGVIAYLNFKKNNDYMELYIKNNCIYRHTFDKILPMTSPLPKPLATKVEVVEPPQLPEEHLLQKTYHKHKQQLCCWPTEANKNTVLWILLLTVGRQLHIVEDTRH